MGHNVRNIAEFSPVLANYFFEMNYLPDTSKIVFGSEFDPFLDINKLRINGFYVGHGSVLNSRHSELPPMFFDLEWGYGLVNNVGVYSLLLRKLNTSDEVPYFEKPNSPISIPRAKEEDVVRLLSSRLELIEDPFLVKIFGYIRSEQEKRNLN